MALLVAEEKSRISVQKWDLASVVSGSEVRLQASFRSQAGAALFLILNLLKGTKDLSSLCGTELLVIVVAVRVDSFSWLGRALCAPASFLLRLAGKA